MQYYRFTSCSSWNKKCLAFPNFFSQIRSLADASPWLHAGVQPASKKRADTI